METYIELAKLIEQNDLAGVKRIVLNEFPLNDTDEDGAPILFYAIMQGDLDIIRFLIDQGANVNFIAQEPAATIYAEKPLELAQGLRFIMDWNKYQPVAKLLKENGATDSEENAESSNLQEVE